MAEKDKINILIAASEFEPYTNVGHLGRVVSNLSVALVEQYAGGATPRRGELDVRVVIPKYACIPGKYTDGAMPIAEFSSTLGRRTYQCKVYKTIFCGVPVYLMSCGDYFEREEVYSTVGDDVERYSFFCNAVIDMRRRVDFIPDVIQCHDWQLSYIPTLHRAGRSRGMEDGSFKTLLAIHSMQYQGLCSRYDMLDLLDLSSEVFTPATLEFYGQANSLKGGLLFSDWLVTVSANYATEIQHAYYGENLEGIIRARAQQISGIMCGIDHEIYDPRSDRDIFANYDEANVAENKPKNKRKLQQLLGFEVNPDIPLVIVISDVLDYDKGIDLVKFVFDDIMALGVQVVLASKGSTDCHDFFVEKSADFPGTVAYVQYHGTPPKSVPSAGWDETADANEMRAMAAEDAVFADEANDAPGAAELAAFGGDGGPAETMLICGSDILLRPSRVEPCGEKHLIALRYGTIPIVRETGGLKDVVVSYVDGTGEGNGFSFFNYNAHDMLFTLSRALDLYRGDRDAWYRLVRSAMGEEIVWKGTADKYAELYRAICEA